VLNVFGQKAENPPTSTSAAGEEEKRRFYPTELGISGLASCPKYRQCP